MSDDDNLQPGKSAARALVVRGARSFALTERIGKDLGLGSRGVMENYRLLTSGYMVGALILVVIVIILSSRLVMKRRKRRNSVTLDAAGDFVTHLDVKPGPGEVARLHQMVDALGEKFQISQRSCAAMKLAIDEIMTNIFLHSNVKQGSTKIAVDLILRPGSSMTAKISDNGPPFNPLTTPDADTHSSWDQRPLGGLGIHLVRNLVDNLEYQRTGELNILIMTKNAIDNRSR